MCTSGGIIKNYDVFLLNVKPDASNQ